MELKPKQIRKKNYLFSKERSDILNKILLLTSTKINSRNVESNANIKQELDIIIPDIKKYFSTSNWPAFKPNTTKKHISLIKSILNDMNINYETIILRTNLNNKSSTVTIYSVNI